MHILLLIVISSTTVIITYAIYLLVIAERFNPLRILAGPPTRSWFQTHLHGILDPEISPRVHEYYVQKYGRSIRIQGLGPWDQRLLTLDSLSVAHILKNSTIYEKPWQSRRLITNLIGCGMFAAEGEVHKRQRRVATPAFSVQSMRALVPLVFKKGTELRDTWSDILQQSGNQGCKIDVCHWISRATFDVIGLAGFDYNFDAIRDGSNELFVAYKEMFEVVLSQGHPIRTILRIYAPFMSSLLPDGAVDKVVKRCHNIVHRVAGHLIQEKKRKIKEGEETGIPYDGKDLLSLLLKANMATDLPENQRISDVDILHNINTFMFAGSDSSSLSLTWTLFLLAQNSVIQEHLRAELLSVTPMSSNDFSKLTDDEIQSLHTIISNLPYLHNVTRECLRLIPPIHSTIRVATQDDKVPTISPVHCQDGTIITDKSFVLVPKGSFVHVAIEGFNLDKGVWGDDAWEFHPDRWDHLPEGVSELPGQFSNTLTFSSGPRSCIGMRFSLIEIKTFLYILLTNFVFQMTDDKVIRANVVLTRPYISGKFKQGSQCPLLITPYSSTRHS